MVSSRIFLSVVAAGLLPACASPLYAALDLFTTETFDNQTGFSKANDSGTSVDFFISNFRYWGINDGSGEGDYDGDTGNAPPFGVPSYSGFSGNFFNGSAIDAPGGDYSDLPLTLTWSGSGSGIDISSAAGATIGFSGLFAAEDNENFEADDRVTVRYQLDGGGYTDLLSFSGDSGGDLALDGVSTKLTETAATFTAVIPSSAASALDIQIEMVSNNAFREDFAFDTLQLSVIPEASAFLFGGVVCGVLGIGTLSRKRRRGPAVA